MNKLKSSVKKVSVILPTYNEKENITLLISEVFRHVPYETEIIVVDDDSPDETWRVVMELAKKNKNLRLLRRMDKRGLVSALNDGIAASEGNVVAWMDSDLSMPPEKLKELLEKIDEGFDAAVASRFVKGGGIEIITGSRDTALAYILSLSLNRFVQKMLNSSFKDYTSGFIALRKEILEKNPLRGDYGEYFIELIHRTRKKGYTTVEIPYISLARQRGTSKTGTHLFQYLKRGVKYIKVAVRLKFTKTVDPENGKH